MKDVKPVAPIKHKLYTTHDASKLLHMDPATITKWIDKGFILAYRTPGGHRRIQAPHLVAFLKCFEMPIPEELSAYQNQEVPMPTRPAALQHAKQLAGRTSFHHRRAHK